jgi:hypothetical protein
MKKGPEGVFSKENKMILIIFGLSVDNFGPVQLKSAKNCKK